MLTTPSEKARAAFLPGDRATWPEMLPAELVAAVLFVSVRTLWRLTAAGKVPQPVRWNRKLARWRKVDVVAWLDGQRSP